MQEGKEIIENGNKKERKKGRKEGRKEGKKKERMRAGRQLNSE